MRYFFISALVHLLFLCSVAFTFEGNSAVPSPTLIFLGSILQSQDLFYVRRDRNKPSIIPSNIPLKTPVDEGRFTFVDKPSFSKKNAKEEILLKQLLGTTTETPQKGPNNNNTDGREEIAPYQPLKLDTP